MRASAVTGFIFANSHDNTLKELTENRSMASVPFGARYRLVDFLLSSFSNAGITGVGIITKENFRSLMDHVGNGVYWDLDRKSGGLTIIPPFSSSGVRQYSGTADALAGAKGFILASKSDYVVLGAADVLANVDIGEVISTHISQGSDITMVYHKCHSCVGNEQLFLNIEQNGRITTISKQGSDEEENRYIGITMLSRALLISLIEESVQTGCEDFFGEVLASKTRSLKIAGYEHTGFVAIMNDLDTYYKANMALLDPSVRRDLFPASLPVYTKNRDDMPTRYGLESQVSNSFIADGCVIHGTVKNSIIFRGVQVEKGAVVEDSILMQDAKVGENATVKNVITDKNVVIREETTVKGSPQQHYFLAKNQVL